MSSARLLFSACYRDIPVYPQIVLRNVESSGGFLETDAPLPVGTMLILAPVESADLHVPARVISVVEACRTGDGSGELPGMTVVFEAQIEQLLAHAGSVAPPSAVEVPMKVPTEAPLAAPAGAIAAVDEVEPAEPPDEPALEVVAAQSPPGEVVAAQSAPGEVVAAQSEPALEVVAAQSAPGEVVEMEADYDAPEEEGSDPLSDGAGVSDGDEQKKKKKNRARGGRRKKR